MTRGLPPSCIRAQREWASCRSAAEQAGPIRGVSFEAIVRHYIRYHRVRAKAELKFYAGLPRSEAVRRAARAERLDGKRHNHQTRITKTAIRRASRTLAQLNVRRCRSFDELHELLTATIGSQPGIGRLMVYDTAVRIGANLGLAPRHVYLHAGTRKGAAALGLGRGRDYVRVDELPGPLRRLAPHEIEDCLCIYKDELATVSRRVRR